MDEVRRLEHFLPISFNADSEQEYLSFLWETVEENYANRKYQFSFLAYHMILMVLFYFKIWQIRRIRFEDFEKGLIGFSSDDRKSLLNDRSPFVFSSVRESSILRLFKLVGCGEDRIGSYVKLVRDRNRIAHSNGLILIRDQQSFDDKTNEALRIAGEIQMYQRDVMDELYREFLNQSSDLDTRQHLDPIDQIREALIRDHYMSWEDVKVCLDFDISSMKDVERFQNIEILHGHLRDIYDYGLDIEYNN